MSTSLKAPFPWYGGKSTVSEIVWRAFGEIGNYVEPFAGSLAVLLRRPGEGPWTETVNDKDGFLANFWRAVRAAPEKVAQFADWPVNEADLHSRHAWLVQHRVELTEQLLGDPEYFNAKIAGWWCWGLCCWIGSGWCSGTGPWRQIDGRLVRTEGGASKLSRPWLGKGGRGVHSGAARKRPALHKVGVGVHQQGVRITRPHVSGNSHGNGVHRQKPTIHGLGGKGINGPTQSHLVDWMQALATRLRRVRVTCGDWARVMTPSVIRGNGYAGVFLDPPYVGVGNDLYASDARGVAEQVHAWALEHAEDPKTRIALCGYEGEFQPPAGWREYAWKSRGGYARTDNDNCTKERIWFSPQCIDFQAQPSLFAGVR